MPPVLAAIGLGLSAVGTGISVIGGIQQANRANSLAQFNAMAQEQNARQQQQATLAQAAMIRQQAGFAEAQARMNNALAQSEAQARENNAQTLRNQADSQTSVDRENIKRTQLEQERIAASQRVAIAGSGAVESGSPLAVLIETKGAMQSALNEQQYESNLTRTGTLARASLEDFGAKIAKEHAGIDLWSGLAAAGLQRDSAKLEEFKGASLYRRGMQEAEITRMAGAANAQGAKWGAFGSLFSGLGNLGTQWASWKQDYSGFGGPALAYAGAGHSVGLNPLL